MITHKLGRHPYPAFIKDHQVFKNFPIEKGFDEIGLKDFSMTIKGAHGYEGGKYWNGKKVVFSTKPWDIATMSMRGTKSCMRWDSGHAKQLVGSIADPYCGIIFITNGNKLKHGQRMLYRALVRVVQAPTKKIAMLERMYPRIDREFDTSKLAHIYEAEAIFTVILNDRTGGNSRTRYRLGLDIPLSEQVQSLTYDYRSCVDSGTPYAYRIV
jgi:hypothetical protein